MLSSIRSFNSIKKNGLRNGALSWEKRYQKEFNDASDKIIFKIIAININNLEKRLKIEAQYAYDNKSKYWAPQPGQFKYLK